MGIRMISQIYNGNMNDIANIKWGYEYDNTTNYFVRI